MWNVGRLCAVFLVTIVSVNGQGLYNCPPPWLEFMDKCINFVLTGLPEATAAADCEKDGAALVSVDSVDKNQFIVGQLTKFEKQGREWYTSGVQNATSADPNAFMWEGTGKQIVGQQFWLSDFYRNPTRGNRIVYHTDDGITWGWARSTESDAKPYICEIERSDVYKIMGEDRTFGYGTLETDSLKWEYGPSFTMQPNETYYDTSGVEQFVALVCMANGNPQPSYTWYNTQLQVRSVINPAKDSRVTITSGRLVINQPNKDTDIGDYQCAATNKFGTIMSNTVLIKFGYLLDFPKSQRDPINAKPYQGVGIECYPPKSGYPVLMYTWFKGAIPNFVRTELKPYIFISNFGKLYFSYVTKDDQDNYYCQVSAPRATMTAATGKVSLPIPLRVSEDIASIREPEIASGFPAIFPSNPLLGDDVRIECFAWGVGTPQLDYNWIRVDGKGLPANSQIREQGRVLMFYNVQPINAGQYQCSATRRNGQTASKMVLLNVEASPYFTIPMKDQHLDEGQTATFRCYGDGIPAVTFSWLRNGTLLNIANLSPDDQARISISSNVLTIGSVKPSDAGMYQCAVSNTHATRYDAAQLRVLSFAPTFVKYPLQAKQYATRDGEVTIMCQPEAAPQATIEWQFNGSPLSSSATQLANGNLHFNSVSEGDQGVYTCIATNKYGTASSSGNLTVVEQTTISNPPRDLVVQVNKTAFMMCEASYYPVIDITYSWLHSQFPVEFYRLKTDGSSKVWIERDKYYMMGEGINRGSLYITATQFYHAGEYTCLAESTAVTVKAIATLQVIGPPSQTAGVYGIVLNPYSVQLYWTDGSVNGQPIIYYVIESYNMNDKIWISAKLVNDPNEVSIRNTKVDNLQPYTSYMFRVRAANVIGVGEPSDPSPAYTTLAAAPTVPPSRVGGGGGKVGVLTITWDPVSRTEQMGDGFGYTVQWRKKGVKDEEWTTRNVPGAESSMYTALVGTVNYYKEYEVSVQCYNKIGRSPRSDIVTIRSSEDLPVAVAKNIHAIYYNATALQPEWDPVENTLDNIRGVLKGYRINYWAPDYYPDATWAQFKVILGETPRGIILGLYPFTYYRVSIQVMNTAGFGPVSQEFAVKTLRNAPLTAPQELRANVSGWDSAIISWRGVSTGPMEEPLVGYVLRYWTQGENIFLAKDIDVKKKMHYQLTGLDQNIIYSVRVYGYSRGGAGTQSPTLEFILGPNCVTNEISLDKDYIYVCGSCSLTSLSSVLLLLSLVAHSLMRLQLW